MEQPHDFRAWAKNGLMTFVGGLHLMLASGLLTYTYLVG